MVWYCAAAASAAVLVLWASTVQAGDYYHVPDGERVIDKLKDGHPRLMLTDARLAELRKLAESDEYLAGLVKDTIARADELRKANLLERKLIGPRLLHTSRELVRRSYALGLAYRWTGKKVYARKLRENLLAVCSFEDWNPPHFLDVAEMAHGVGVGYDWIHDILSEDDRTKIRSGLAELGLKPGLRAYRKDTRGRYGLWWARVEHNWNQVCNAGLMVGALAIAETDPNYAKVIVPGAVGSLPKALASYVPDGAWGEGPSYWGYATRYTVYGLAGLDTALGTDFGLSDANGLDKAGDFPLHMVSPTGRYLNYADVGEHSAVSDTPSLLWLAKRYDKPVYAHVQRKLAGSRQADPRNVIWYVPQAEVEPEPLPLDKQFRGEVPLAVFRSAWGDPNALWVGVKGGTNRVNHGHLDLGNFELEADGIRWARDLGKDNYNLPGYWDKRQGGRRWSYYRLGSTSHNVLLVDGENQRVDAKAEMGRFDSDKDRGLAVVEIDGAYPGKLKSHRRGVMLDRRRGAVIVQDEVEVARACTIVWGITTDAEIEVDGPKAKLTQDGRTMHVRLAGVEGVDFGSESAERKEPEQPNKGVRRLVARIKARPGALKIVVIFEPDGAEGAVEALPPALSDWK